MTWSLSLLLYVGEKYLYPHGGRNILPPHESNTIQIFLGVVIMMEPIA